MAVDTLAKAAEEKENHVPGAIAEHDDTLAEATKYATEDATARGQIVSGYEDLGVWETVKHFKINVLFCFLVTFSAATDGYQIGIAGNIIANPGFVREFATATNAAGEQYLTSSVIATWNSLAAVGQIIGMVSLPFLSDRFGRKFAMYFYWSMFALSITTECVAKEWRGWLAAKILGGIGVGSMQHTIPTYIAEVAPARVRGALLMNYSLWFLIGQFFAPVALQVMSGHSPMDYMTAIYTQWSQIGLMFIIYLFVPESPAWCASHEKKTRAIKALTTLHRGVKDFDVEYQYNLLLANVEHEKAIAAQQKHEKWYAIFFGIDGKRTMIAAWTLLTQQFLGLGMFFTMASYFFQQAGLQDPFQATCITSGINIAFSFLVIYLADVTGRRWMACSGTTLCWAATIAVGILGVVPKVRATDILLVLFFALWNVGLVANGATGWGFIGEISSQRLRPYTAGFAAASSCVAGVILSVVNPYMINANEWNWGLKTSWFYAGISLPFTVAIWFLIPEVSGRTHAELDELFERKIKPRHFHKTTTAIERLQGKERADIKNSTVVA